MNHPHLRVATHALLCVALLCLAAPSYADSACDLRRAITERLTLMNDVARFKWNAQLPVTDAEREAALMPVLIRAAVDLGLDAAYADRIVTAQITAARMQQEMLMAQWRAADAGQFDAVPDLALVTRPAITSATTHLLSTLRSHLCNLEPDQQWDPVPPGIDAHAWATATSALLPVPKGACSPH